MSDPADVDEVLSLDSSLAGELVRPIMLIGLTGWFDVAGAATGVLDHLTPDDAVTVAEIDADPFFDFTQERPYTVIDEGEVRAIAWPSNDVRVVFTGGAHDLLVLSGVEPHLSWRTYAACIRRVAQAFAVGAIVTVGSSADAVPHTRVPLVVGSTADAEAARRLGLAAPSYQGVTGLLGVLNAELATDGRPVISLRVGVPHYLAQAEHPRAVAALLHHLAHVLAVPLTIDLDDEIAQWQARHDEAIAEDPQLQGYVRMLEDQYDRRAEASLASGDDLAARFEEYLRGDEPDDA